MYIVKIIHYTLIYTPMQIYHVPVFMHACKHTSVQECPQSVQAALPCSTQSEVDLWPAIALCNTQCAIAQYTTVCLSPQLCMNSIITLSRSHNIAEVSVVLVTTGMSWNSGSCASVYTPTMRHVQYINFSMLRKVIGITALLFFFFLGTPLQFACCLKGL